MQGIELSGKRDVGSWISKNVVIAKE